MTDSDFKTINSNGFDGYLRKNKTVSSLLFDTEDPCDSISCGNNGTCLAQSGTYICQCHPPFTGKNCLDST